ncbi:tyrosine-type recombinase/integrase [Burkholderia cenocepacia]|uniref:tyrosine-type recombinase/integrase n=1 Tax=Burkholderia cenocepacia TaxID=95486 RepID=UPI00264B51CD|nr:integrase arm-type DNA-binding domain-containing protein [Burkholderia cenocepacia]MDN7458177.1 integrase arm-type DNA-binding domain-containing protein [Burkholderia cenocepacia]
MPLTDIAIRNAKAGDKPQKLFDAGGLFLLVTPAGQRYWRFKYRIAGKEKLLALGVYPDVSLQAARKKRDDAREKLASGIDPGEAKKADKRAARLAAATSFEAVTREWFNKHSSGWAKGHSSKIIARFENDVFPWLGKRPISEIQPAEVFDVIRRIEGRGTLDTAHRAKQNCGQVFRYAVATGRATRDVTADLRGALPPIQQKHFAAITDPDKVGELLRAFDAFGGTFPVHCALKLAPMLFRRPGELRAAEWSEIDLDNATWEIDGARMKRNKADKMDGGAHIVPLPNQAVAILHELHALTGGGRYVFPGARDRNRPMSEATINAALRRLGYDTRTEITGHGFRAMARTIMVEVLGVAVEVIESQLSHTVKDPLGRAYNRTTFLPQRREMMQKWADYLDRLKAGAEVIPFSTATR